MSFIPGSWASLHNFAMPCRRQVNCESIGCVWEVWASLDCVRQVAQSKGNKDRKGKKREIKRKKKVKK
eukprot:1161904-Pelagomonas_calceolata.AAC.6